MHDHSHSHWRLRAQASGAMHWLRKDPQPDASFVGQAWCALPHEAAFMASLNATERQFERGWGFLKVCQMGWFHPLWAG